MKDSEDILTCSSKNVAVDSQPYNCCKCIGSFRVSKVRFLSPSAILKPIA